MTLRTIQTAQVQMELMLRALLEDRFQVKVHRETRELPVLEMTVANPGKLKHGDCVMYDPAGPRPTVPGAGQPPVRYCGGSSEGRAGLDWTLERFRG